MKLLVINFSWYLGRFIFYAPIKHFVSNTGIPRYLQNKFPDGNNCYGYL